MLKFMRSQLTVATTLVCAFKLRTCFALPFTLMLLPTIAFADSAARLPHEPAVLPPIFVEADQFKVFFDQEKAVWRGNVEATQGNYTFRASSLTVHMDQVQAPQQADRREHSSTSSPGAGFELQADALSYDIDTDRIIASGNSELRRGVELIRAEQIIYQVGDRLATAQPQANGRVQVQFFSNPSKPLFHPRSFDEGPDEVAVAAE
jgi:lipopolysaccharide transport protein LptA